MSGLKDAVLVIVDEMENHLSNNGTFSDDKIESWSKQLKLFCMVAQDTPAPQPPSKNLNQEWYNKATEEAALTARTAKKDVIEETTPIMTLLVGGKDDGDCIQTDPAMPIGAKSLVEGEVYIMSQERKLVFSDSETKKYNNLHKKATEEEDKIILGA